MQRKLLKQFYLLKLKDRTKVNSLITLTKQKKTKTLPQKHTQNKNKFRWIVQCKI